MWLVVDNPPRHDHYDGLMLFHDAVPHGEDDGRALFSHLQRLVLGPPFRVGGADPG